MKFLLLLKMSLIFSLFGVPVFSLSKTDARLQAALAPRKQKKAKTIMIAARRRADLQSFVDAVHRVGLHFVLRGYGGKQPKSKRAKKFLSLVGVGDKITVLAPLGSAFLPVISKLRTAQVQGNRKVLAQVKKEITELLLTHIIKGEFKQADLKGQLETISGKKIDADKIVIQAGDIVAGNGILHVVKQLVTPVQGAVFVSAEQVDESKTAQAASAQESVVTPAAPVPAPASDAAVVAVESQPQAAAENDVVVNATGNQEDQEEAVVAE